MKLDFGMLFPLILLLAPVFYALDLRPSTKPAVATSAVCEETQGPAVCGASQVFIFDR